MAARVSVMILMKILLYSTRVSAEKYVVYVVYHNFDHDQPRVIYFMFNPERTRMITVDIDMYH